MPLVEYKYGHPDDDEDEYVAVEDAVDLTGRVGERRELRVEEAFVPYEVRGDGTVEIFLAQGVLGGGVNLHLLGFDDGFNERELKRYKSIVVDGQGEYVMFLAGERVSAIVEFRRVVPKRNEVVT